MESRGFEGPLYTVIMGVLILGVVVAQAQVEPTTCCKDTRGTNCIAGSRRPHNCRCKFVSAGTKCPRDYPVMGTPQNSDVGEKAHTHVKGYNVNCPATEAKLCFDKCRLTPELCAEKCVCTLTPPDRNINCPTTEARMCYDVCRLPRELCLKKCGCTLSLGDISHYCKLGCTSSVCNTMTTLHNTDAGAKGAVEHCNNACSEFCTKGANIAMVTA